jgi:hypothetical protein
MDRLKADFIASLPMQPSGCVCYLFLNVLRQGFAGLSQRGSDRKMLSHPPRVRSVRHAGRVSRKAIEKEFLRIVFARDDFYDGRRRTKKRKAR